MTHNRLLQDEGKNIFMSPENRTKNKSLKMQEVPVD